MLKNIVNKMQKNKKMIAIVSTFCLIFAMTCVNAAEGETTSSYAGLVNQLNNGLGASAFTGVIGDVLPYIITVTIVALVWYLIKKAIKKFSKGKPGV